MKKNNKKTDPEFDEFLAIFEESVTNSVFELYDILTKDKTLYGVILIYPKGLVMYNTFKKNHSMFVITPEDNEDLLQGFVINNTKDDFNSLIGGILGHVWIHQNKMAQVNKRNLN